MLADRVKGERGLSRITDCAYTGAMRHSGETTPSPQPWPHSLHTTPDLQPGL